MRKPVRVASWGRNGVKTEDSQCGPSLEILLCFPSEGRESPSNLLFLNPLRVSTVKATASNRGPQEHSPLFIRCSHMMFTTHHSTCGISDAVSDNIYYSLSTGTDFVLGACLLLKPHNSSPRLLLSSVIKKNG